MTIVRTWKGVVRKTHESAYMDFLRGTGLRDYAATEGNLGSMCMTRDTAEGVEFTLMTFWRSIDAIKRFAGEDYTKARYYPEDDGFLLSKPERVEHFELIERRDSNEPVREWVGIGAKAGANTLP